MFWVSFRLVIVKLKALFGSFATICDGDTDELKDVEKTVIEYRKMANIETTKTAESLLSAIVYYIF